MSLNRIIRSYPPSEEGKVDQCCLHLGYYSDLRHHLKTTRRLLLHTKVSNFDLFLVYSIYRSDLAMFTSGVERVKNEALILAASDFSSSW